MKDKTGNFKRFKIWFKDNFIVPPELKKIMAEKNNKNLMKYICPIFFVFGFSLLLVVLFANKNPVSEKIPQIVYYSGFAGSSVITYFWCLYQKKHPSKKTPKIQPFHFQYIIILLDVLFTFSKTSPINPFIIFVCVSIIAPIMFYIEPVVFGPLSMGALLHMAVSIKISLSFTTIMDLIIFAFILQIMSFARWNSVKKDFINNQKQQAYINDMEQEINLANIVQASFFKHDDIPYEHWSVVFYNKAMAGVSGDFFDIYHNDTRLEGLGIFDVSGHGVSSGLVTMLVKNIIYNEFYKGKKKNLKEVVEQINQQVIKEKGNIQNYLTGILTRLSDSTAEFVTAGHGMPILYKADQMTADYFQNDGQVTFGAIGMQNVPASYGYYTVDMKSGDELIFYTDGITDAVNSEKEAFGKERLLKSVKRNMDRPLNTQLNCIISDVHNFALNMPQNDDITLIILKKK